MLAQCGDFLLVHRLRQCIACWEVAVKRPDSHAGKGCEVVKAAVELVAAKSRPCGSNYRLAVACPVSAQTFYLGHPIPFSHKWR